MLVILLIYKTTDENYIKNEILRLLIFFSEVKKITFSIQDRKHYFLCILEEIKFSYLNFTYLFKLDKLSCFLHKFIFFIYLFFL